MRAMTVWGLLVLLPVAEAAAHDSMPITLNCAFDGLALTARSDVARLQREIRLNLLGQPPIRGDLSETTESELACLYVAGWREKPVEGNNLSSETYCYASSDEVFACQVISSRTDPSGLYEFNNMECNNSELDQITLSSNGDAVLSRFAPITSLQQGHSRDFYLGSGRCELAP